jgi:hypothetical protein
MPGVLAARNYRFPGARVREAVSHAPSRYRDEKFAPRKDRRTAAGELRFSERIFTPICRCCLFTTASILFA